MDGSAEAENDDLFSCAICGTTEGDSSNLTSQTSLQTNATVKCGHQLLSVVRSCGIRNFILFHDLAPLYPGRLGTPHLSRLIVFTFQLFSSSSSSSSSTAAIPVSTASWYGGGSSPVRYVRIQ